MIYPSARCWTLPAWRRQTLQITPRYRRDLFFFLMQKFLWLQLRDHPSKRQTDEPNAHELLLLVTAKNRGSRCEEAFSSESGQSMLEKDIFEMQIVRSWFKDGLRVKAFGAPLILFHFLFFFFLVWSLLGCFMHATLQERRAKRDDLTQEKTAFFGGEGNVFSQVWSVQVYWICSPLEHTFAHSARTWRIHTLTQCTTPELLSTSRGREREEKKNPLQWWLTLLQDGPTLSRRAVPPTQGGSGRT